MPAEIVERLTIESSDEDQPFKDSVSQSVSCDIPNMKQDCHSVFQ